MYGKELRCPNIFGNNSIIFYLKIITFSIQFYSEPYVTMTEFVPKDVANIMNLLLYRILNGQSDILERYRFVLISSQNIIYILDIC